MLPRPCLDRLRHIPRRMPKRKKPRPPPSLRLIRIHRPVFVMAATRMRYMVTHAAKRAFGPSIEHIEHQRHMNPDGRMQRARRVPRLEPDPADILSLAAPSRSTGSTRLAITCQSKALLNPPAYPRLHPFQRAIDITHRSRRTGFFPQNVPGLQSRAQFHRGVVHRNRPGYVGSGNARCGANHSRIERVWPRALNSSSALIENPVRHSAAA